MKIAIIDDFLPDAQKLREFISRYCHESKLALEIEIFSSGEAFLTAATASAVFDLAFLDVLMGGMSGIDTARRLREAGSNCLLIFVTSSEDHAIESYRVRAFDYLTKPYTYEQLHATLQLCDEAILRGIRYIEVKEGRVHIKILLRDILYTDYFNHYIHIHTKERVIRSYIPFAEFSQLLLPHPQFICCYRNCIVNMDAVSAIEDKDFILEGGARVPIARAQRVALRQTYTDYAFSRLCKVET